jgi:hypothetical protein
MEALLFWLKTNQDLLQNIGILVGFAVTAYTLKTEARARRIDNLITFTQQHRDIWKMMYEYPEVARVRDPHADLKQEPMTAQEHRFASLLILHLATVYRTSTEGMFVVLPGLRNDISMSFALPIPRAVWEEMKHLQSDDFVQFVESCLQPFSHKD